MSTEARPAFYALAPGGWRDYLTLLHPPYTLWHLSYVAIGAALAPHLHPGRLAATAAAFFLAVGIGAHALDELNGRPLRTRIPDGTLIGLAVASIGAAVMIGVVGAIQIDLWLLAFVAFGAFIVVVYNLELLGGGLHNDLWFGLAWGGFPLLTGYFAAAERITGEALLGAAFATLLSLAQRALSTQVRTVRRRVVVVSGSVEFADGRREPVTPETLIRAPELGLRLLSASVLALAGALLVLRLA
ncbi:MAG: hypothetical protein WBB74_08745 [Gaiellaceae bacterium]